MCFYYIEKIQGWTESVETLSGVARKHPQSAYAGLQKSLQQEWAFLQQVTPDIGYNLVPLEQALRETFIPALFQGLGEGTPCRGNTRERGHTPTCETGGTGTP